MDTTPREAGAEAGRAAAVKAQRHARLLYGENDELTAGYLGGFSAAVELAARRAAPPPAVYAVTGPGQLGGIPVATAAGAAIAEEIARGLSASSGIGGTYAATARGQVTSTFTAGRRDPGPFDGYQVPA